MITAVVLRIRKSKFQIYDGTFWFVLSILLLVLSIFPQIAINISRLIGVESPANLVFLCILSLLLLKNFLLSVKISFLEYRVVELAQQIAVEKVDKTDNVTNIKIDTEK
jgi:hypothetical protein